MAHAKAIQEDFPERPTDLHSVAADFSEGLMSPVETELSLLWKSYEY